MLKLLLASHNQGKIAELKAILEVSGLRGRFKVISLDHLNSDFLEVAETGKTFSENALLKAKTFANHYQLLCLADDSGLEVNALEGFPGVNSARWHPGSDQARNLALLKKIAQLETELGKKIDRSAQFVTSLCLYSPFNQNYWFFNGKLKGKIARQAKGTAGFGYDPLFIAEGSKQTLAELGLKQKNKISHRSRALKKLAQFLKVTDDQQFLSTTGSNSRKIR